MANFDLIPDVVWVHATRTGSSFVLHHTRCGVIQDEDCDCEPIMVGMGMGIDRLPITA